MLLFKPNMYSLKEEIYEIETMVYKELVNENKTFFNH